MRQKKEWHISYCKYNPKDFVTSADIDGELEIKLIKANEINEGDWIITQKGGINFNIFIVDFIESEFCDNVTDEMIKEYKDDFYPEEWSKYQFIFEDNGGSKGLSFENIAYNAEFLVIRKKYNYEN